ncbi:hypothetical protein BGX34_008943 [Mortierella sp. NVP85]|nr:hypothetical protein BGX34_008943 [Mortierella sp. NVP85]
MDASCSGQTVNTVRHNGKSLRITNPRKQQLLVALPEHFKTPLTLKMSKQQQQQQQDYIQIEEDMVPESSTPTVIQLRNLAYSRPSSSTPRPTTRAEVLESLMPLSRNPWSSVPTLLTDSPQAKPKSPTSSSPPSTRLTLPSPPSPSSQK